MNIYLDEKVIFDKQNAPIKDVAFSKSSKESIMAVLYEREVQFLDEQHQPLFAPYTSISRITATCWSPVQSKFVIGHENGLVCLLNLESGELKEDPETHASEILRIDFSANGGLIVTQDKGFLVAFWKGMSLVKTVQKSAPIGVMLFVNFTHERKDKLSKVVKLGFLGDKMGCIEYFEEKRLTLQELCKINGSIKEMFFYGKSNSIIVITSTYYFVQFKISTEEDIVPDKKLKLSMANSAEHLTGIWMEPNTLLLNSKEPILKFWNIEENTNYSIGVQALLGREADASRLKILQLKFNQRSEILYCLLSTGQLILLQKKQGAGGSEERAWRTLEAPELDAKAQVARLNVEQEGVIVAVYQGFLEVFKTAQLKLFVDFQRNLKFLVKSNKLVEYFETLAQDVKAATSAEPFDDLLISEQSVVILTKKREILVATLLEFLSSAGKLSPVLAEGSAVFGLKKYSKIDVFDRSAKITLAKNGYIALSRKRKISFVSYKTSVQSDYCAMDQNEVFQAIEFNPNFEHFALLNNQKVIKVFDISQNSLKLLHEDIDFKAIIEGFSLNNAKEKSKAFEKDTEYFISEIAKKTNPLNHKEIKFAADSNKNSEQTNIEQLKIDHSGTCLLFLTNSSQDNLVCHHIPKRLSTSATIPRFTEIESIQFDKGDSRYFCVFGKHPGNTEAKLIWIFVLEEEQIHLFDKIEVPSNRHFLGSAFPEIYLSFYDDQKHICTEVAYPSLFAGLLKDQPGDLTVKAFAKEFCFNVSSKRLNKALMALKRLEKNYELESFWKSLFDIALEKRNLKIAELCLGKMKFVRASQFVKMQEQGPDRLAAAASENHRMGQLALAFNNLPLAKRIFFEERDFAGIAHILFSEGRYEDLVCFCQQHEKSLLNFYLFEVAKISKASGNYSEFFHLAKRSKIADEFIVRALDFEQDAHFLANYLQTENSRQASLLFFLHYKNTGENERAKAQLEKHKDLKPELAEFLIKQGSEADAVKSLSLSGSDPGSNRICTAIAAHKENLKDHCAAVELLIKGQNYLKAIALLIRHKEFFEENENFKAKILDLMFSQILQTEQHYAAGALANYFVSMGLFEKAIKLYLHINDCQRAYWLAKNHNLGQLLGTIEGRFSNILTSTAEEPKIRESKIAISEVNRSSLPKEAELITLLDNGKHEQALSFFEANKSEIGMTEEIVNRAKKLGEPFRAKMLAKAAKALKNGGQIDQAIELYLELKDNKRAFKAMAKANQTAKIIQFANFCREDAIFVQAANYLQTSDMKANDQIYSSIVLFYCKAKQFKMAIDFIRNFSTTCFESQDFDGCLSLLEKAEKLVERLTEGERAAYSNLFAKDMLFLAKYKQTIEKMDQMNFQEACFLAEELLASGKNAIFWNPFKLGFVIFMCALNLNLREKVIEVGKRLEEMDLPGFSNSLDRQERDFYLELNPNSRLHGNINKEEEIEEIEENLV